jgi:MGT family glycosyltransferase
MATVAILIDAEQGHILPSFWLSHRLITHHHKVYYLGPPAAGSLVRKQGYEFIPIMSDPRVNTPRQITPGLMNNDYPERENIYFSSLVSGELLDRVIADLKPQVALVLSLFYFGGLFIRYRYRLPVIYFKPFLSRYSRMQEREELVGSLLNLRSGVPELVELLTEAKVEVRNFSDIAELVFRLPELVMVPRAFELPEVVTEPWVHYVGAGVDLKRNEEPFSWEWMDPHRPLIYCSRGSQAHLQKEPSRRCFQAVIDAAADRPDWQFIIAVGKAFEIEEFGVTPSNVVLRQWVPQLEILSRASVMIHHGGLGTIKECILTGTPMVAVPEPDCRDQLPCSERVVYHGLGVKSDTDRISSPELICLIDQIIGDRSFKERVNLMREKFMQEDRSDLAVKIIESQLV